MAEPVTIPHTIPKSMKRRAPAFTEAQMKIIAQSLVAHVNAKTAPLLARIAIVRHLLTMIWT